MKYKEIREKLQRNGFSVKGTQTDYFLNMAHFKHQTIKDCWVDVSFGQNGDEEDFPENTIVDYQNGGEPIDSVNVASVVFNYDMAIAYYNSDSQEENFIELIEDDIDTSFNYVVDIIVNNQTYLEYSTRYFEEIKNFNNNIKRLLNIIESNGFDEKSILRINGSETSLYTSFQIVFNYPVIRDGIVFEFNPITFKHNCFIQIFGEDFNFDINIPQDEFEKELNQITPKYVSLYNKLTEKRKKK